MIRLTCHGIPFSKFIFLSVLISASCSPPGSTLNTHAVILEKSCMHTSQVSPEDRKFWMKRINPTCWNDGLIQDSCNFRSIDHNKWRDGHNLRWRAYGAHGGLQQFRSQEIWTPGPKDAKPHCGLSKASLHTMSQTPYMTRHYSVRLLL